MTYIYLIVGLIVLVVLIAVAIAVLKKARALAIDNNEPLSTNELTDFDRMREEGTISEEEYRRLKKVVAVKTLDKVKGK